MDFNINNAMQGGLLGGLFGGNGDNPYQSAMDQYREWAGKAQDVQNPFLNEGKGAIPDFQKWLQGQSDPGKFINNLTNQYQESPFTKYLQQQSMLAGQNAASAGGLMGSTPFMNQMQQNSSNIAQGGLHDWLANVLGINTQYGEGMNNQINRGANAANALTNMYGQMGEQMGQAAYGKQQYDNQGPFQMLGNLAAIGSKFL